jgi:Kef-type K+ transport system membrane component KefB
MMQLLILMPLFFVTLGMTIKISKSTRKGKKWVALLSTGKSVHFGANDYEDYT